MSTFISLDLETTGVDPSKDKIIEFGAVKFDLNGEKERLQFLVNPGIPLPKIITHITKLQDKDLKNKPLIKEKLQEIKEFIGKYPIIGHNIEFDTSFLKNNGIEIKNLEFDTYNLASILIPGLPSYSLEILSHILKLKHREKHRALEDAIAAMDLFLGLVKKLNELPSETAKEIKEIANKSDWKLKELISQIEIKENTRKTKKIPFKIPSLLKILKSSTGAKNLAKKIIENFGSSLLEIPPPYLELSSELAKICGKNTYICVSNEIFNQLSLILPENIALLDSPQNYISTNRLNNFKNKDHFTESQATALIKYLIWSRQTSTGLIKELNLLKEEKETINFVNADPDFTDIQKEIFVQQAVKKDEDSPAVCTFEYIIKLRPQLNEHLIIIDFEKFAKELFFLMSEKMTLEKLILPLNTVNLFEPENKTIESLISKSIILFGLLGVFYENHNNRDSYNPRAIFRNELFFLKEWHEINDLINNLISISLELGEIYNENTSGYLKKWKQNLKILKNFFDNPDLENNMIFLELNYNKDIVIEKTPVSLKNEMSEIFALSKNFTLIDECFDIGDDGKFIKSFFGLEEGLNLIRASSKREDLKIQIAKAEENQFKHVLKLIEEKKGRTAMIFNSKQQLELFTLKLSPILTEKKIALISQMTGSTGKLEEKFNQDPENSIVLMTIPVWERFKYNDQIQTLIIQKIPFEAPGNILLFSLSQTFKNSFTDLQIPRACIAVKKILNRLTASDSLAVFLDARIHEKDYCRPILNTMNTIGEVEYI